MRAKLIKAIEGQEHLLQVGNTYQVLNNSMDEETPLIVRNERGLNHYMSTAFYEEHFAGRFSPSASDFVFNAERTDEPEDAASIAMLLNGIINENGGFACFTAADVLAEIEARA